MSKRQEWAPAINFGGAGSGVVIAPYAGSTVVVGLCLFPAENLPESDPNRPQLCQWPLMEKYHGQPYYHCSDPAMCLVKKTPTNSRQ